MLDDLKFIHQHDSRDALGAAERQWMQYGREFTLDWRPEREIRNVIFAGLDATAAAAQAFKVWPGVDVPFEIIEDITLPDYVHEHSLVIVASHSGEGYEALACFKQALRADVPLKRRPMLVGLGGPGRLRALALEHKVPYIELPSDMPGHQMFGTYFQALACLFSQTPLVSSAVKRATVTAGSWLRTQSADWLPTVPTERNPAKQLARELVGRSIVLQSASGLAPAARLWQLSFQANAKQLAWRSAFPAAAYAELASWSKQPTHKPYAVINLRSQREPKVIAAQFKAAKRVLSGCQPAPFEVTAKGADPIQELAYLAMFGSFVSLYLALANNIDPTPLAILDSFHKAMEATDG